jgi:hypothetical protein
LRVGGPVAGILGASGLKLFACLWFALALGSVTLLPSADGAARRVVAIQPVDVAPAAAPTAERASAVTAPTRSVSLRGAPQTRLGSPRGAPTTRVVGAASIVARPRTGRRPNRRVAVPVVEQPKPPPVAPAAEPVAVPPAPLVETPELPVVGTVSVTPPPLPVAVPEVPAVPELPQVEVPKLP